MGFDAASYIMGKKAGGGPGPGPSPEPTPEPITGVNFIDDYTGEVVYSYTKDQFLALTELPANPTHEGLTSQGWNWTLADAKTQVEAMDYLDIGQMYIPTDEKTHMKIRLYDGRLSPKCGFAIDGTAVIDWGDGSATDTVTGTNSTTVKYTQHDYASAGEYWVTINVTSGTMYIAQVSGYCALLTKNQTSSSYTNENAAYTDCILELYVGANTEIKSIKACSNLTVFTTPNWTAGKTGTFTGNTAESCNKLKCITVPPGITTAPVFSLCYSLAHVSLPASITIAGSDNIFRSTALETMSLPKDLTTIGSYMFQDCKNLNNVKLPSGLTKIPSYCFYRSPIRFITIPSSVTSIEASAFNGCKNLTKIVIPEGVTQIKANAFNGCTGLKEITLPTTLTSLSGDDIFLDCSAIEIVNISDIAKYCAVTISTYSDATPFNAGKAYLYVNGEKIEDFVVPEGITTIPSYAFGGAKFKSVTFNSDLVTVKSGAFYNCADLKSVTFQSGVTTLEGTVFRDCNSLTKLTLPDTITSIGSYFCYGCASLKEVKLPSNLAVIPNTSFAGCPLETITLPTNPTSIEGSAFLSNSVGALSVHEFIVPDTVTTIGGSAFSSGSFEKFTIGSGVTSIGTYAFSSCRKIGELHFKPTTPPTVENSNAWSYIPTDCKIYVPTGTLSAYTSASKYPNPSNYTYIEE